jgi:hypothetical protein
MVILACDGVWDVFSDQEAADLLLERYLTEGPFEDAASVLVRATATLWCFWQYRVTRRILTWCTLRFVSVCR